VKRKAAWLSLAFLLCAGVAGAAAPAVVSLESGGGTALTPAVLQAMVKARGGAIFSGLDKVTARVTTVYAPLDVPVRFGSLQMTARTCNKRPPEELPEETVFVEVDDMQASASPKRIFTGWMFWSSPALNAVEHPVYDVWLIDCIANAPAASAGNE
jgi:hypothetical protein